MPGTEVAERSCLLGAVSRIKYQVLGPAATCFINSYSNPMGMRKSQALLPPRTGLRVASSTWAPGLWDASAQGPLCGPTCLCPHPHHGPNSLCGEIKRCHSWACVGDSPSTLVVAAKLLLGFSESCTSEIQRNSDFQRKSVGVPQRC